MINTLDFVSNQVLLLSCFRGKAINIDVERISGLLFSGFPVCRQLNGYDLKRVDLKPVLRSST